MVVVTHQAEEIWTYDRRTVRPTVQGAAFNMRGQLCRESDDPSSSPGRGKALCPCDVREKKMRAPLLGSAKSIYYVHA